MEQEPPDRQALLGAQHRPLDCPDAQEQGQLSQRRSSRRHGGVGCQLNLLLQKWERNTQTDKKKWQEERLNLQRKE